MTANPCPDGVLGLYDGIHIRTPVCFIARELGHFDDIDAIVIGPLDV